MPKIKVLESIFGLDQEIQEAIHFIPVSDRYVIALSGGLDSIALAYFCIPHLKKYTSNIQIVHVNHGLSPNARMWAGFCEEFCLQLEIPCHVAKVDVICEGEGLEAAARKARYAVFEAYMKEGGVLLQGHHLNDQAETVLMRLCKGLGPESLKGIPKKRLISRGVLFRPWLDLPRELLESSVQAYQLAWVEDESNQDSYFERNYLRSEVFPLLKKRQPAIFQNLGRAAKKSQETSEFIYEWCDSQKDTFLSNYYADQFAIDIANLKTYSNKQQVFIVRFWLDLLGVRHPTEGSFQRIFDDLLSAGSDSKAEVCWQDNVLRVFDNTLFCFPISFKTETEFSFELFLPESAGQTLVKRLPHGRLTISLCASGQDISGDGKITYHKNTACYEMYCQIPKSLEPLTVRSRKGGDKVYLHAKHSASLKKLYQSNKILPWHRDKLPLLSSGSVLIGSLAGFIAKDFLCSDQQSGLKATSPQRVFYFCFELT